MQRPAESATGHAPMLPVPFRVREIVDEIPGCRTLRVVPEGDAGDTVYAPGQFYMIYVFGQGEVPISVSGDPGRAGELSFTVMAVGTVTRALCSVKPGDAVGLRGPFGQPWPVEAIRGRHVIVMAGGLGLAPLRPALYRMLNDRAGYGDLALLYGTRQPDSIVFAAQLDEWQRNAPLDVAITVDSAGREWSGQVGVVTDLLDDRSLDAANTTALICGPEVMMRFSAYELIDRGVDPRDIYVSMERNMKCAIAACGRCQYGPYFVCQDGPVFSFDRVERLFRIREV